MKSELIFDYIPCNIYYKDQLISLPDEIKIEIERCWNEAILSGKKYTNGDLFTISSIANEGNLLNLYLYLTTYDHYIYSVKKNFTGNYICRSLAANILFLTSDNYYVLAVMSGKTSLPNKIKFIGGAFSKDDIKSGKIDAFTCIDREVQEEIGLSISNKNIITNVCPKYIVTRKNFSFINILFMSELNISRNELTALFKEYKENSALDDFELSDIYFLHNDNNDIKNFIVCNKQNIMSYMEDLFLILMGEVKAGNIKNKINGA